MSSASRIASATRASRADRSGLCRAHLAARTADARNARSEQQQRGRFRDGVGLLEGVDKPVRVNLRIWQADQVEPDRPVAGQIQNLTSAGKRYRAGEIERPQEGLTVSVSERRYSDRRREK